jgi:soluble lytic murein transglycosylase
LSIASNDFRFKNVSESAKLPWLLAFLMYEMKKAFSLMFLAVVACTTSHTQSVNDSALRQVTEKDNQQRLATGDLPNLSLAEHLQRAETYSSNRLFPQARAHWQKILDRFPDDPAVAKALFGIGRSYMWDRDYQKAAFYLLRAADEFPSTKDGREGLAFAAASNVRLGKNLEAAALYQKYISVYSDGERIESAYLNIIDAYREAEKYKDADDWVNRTRQRFSGKPAEANAVQARLRMEIFRQKWSEAIQTADQLLGLRLAASMTSSDEAKYLKAYALEKAGRKAESSALFATLTPSANSYYGGLAFERMNPKGSIMRTVIASAQNYAEYPIVYQGELLKNARSRDVDPRFILAIMKQESTFKPSVKSPAGARGLLQLVFDTAMKYNVKAGYPSLDPDDLYSPPINIAIGTVYISELKNEFDGLYEAVAASYNGGEDNAARWLNRTKPEDPGIFASEVGFAESKNYLFKVMNNYRAYRDLYNEDLTRR